jgi:hypothetical protein
LQYDVKLLTALYFSRSGTATEAELDKLKQEIIEFARSHTPLSAADLQRLEAGDTGAIKEAQRHIEEHVKGSLKKKF